MMSIVTRAGTAARAMKKLAQHIRTTIIIGHTAVLTKYSGTPAGDHALEVRAECHSGQKLRAEQSDYPGTERGLQRGLQ